MKDLGLVIVLLSWVAGGYILTKWRGTNKMSISQHAAQHKHASWLFALVLSAGGALFYYWTVKYFVPRLGLGWLFVALLTLAFVGQFVAGLIADTTGLRRRVHRLAAYGMAYLFLPLSFLMIVAPHVSAIGRVIGAVCFSYLVLGWLLIKLVPKTLDNYLILQALYILAFQIQILSAYYIVN